MTARSARSRRNLSFRRRLPLALHSLVNAWWGTNRCWCRRWSILNEKLLFDCCWSCFRGLERSVDWRRRFWRRLDQIELLPLFQRSTRRWCLGCDVERVEYPGPCQQLTNCLPLISGERMSTDSRVLLTDSIGIPNGVIDGLPPEFKHRVPRIGLRGFSI